MMYTGKHSQKKEEARKLLREYTPTQSRTSKEAYYETRKD